MEDRVVLHGVSWQEYESHLADPEIGHLRHTYDRGAFELCARLWDHERTKMVLFYLLFRAMCYWELNAFCVGSTPLLREDLRRGLAFDLSYYVKSEKRPKLVCSPHALNEPPPDVAVEVEVVKSSLDRPSICAALGVPELWRCNGESISVYRLRPDGAYEWCEQSPTFPLLPLKMLSPFVRSRHELTDGEIMNLFDARLAAEALPDRVVSRP